MNRKHIFFYALLRPLIILFVKLRFGYRYEKVKEPPEPCIVLSNHTTDYDMLFVAASFSRQMYFVASEHIARWKVFRLINYLVAPIVRYKGTAATASVMEMLRKLRQGHNVCMFAEGVRSWDGVTAPIQKATAKLVKTAGCGLVTYKLTGGYFASPMWSGGSVRRGEVRGAPVRVLTAEEIKVMTVEELHRVILEDLHEDAYARQLAAPKAYRGKSLAKGFDNLLFLCPECGSMDTISWEDDRVFCTACGSGFTYDQYGMLSGSRFPTVKALSDWQRRQVAQAVERGEAFLGAEGVLRTVKNHEETFLSQGPVRMSPQELSCGDVSIPMEHIPELAMCGQRAVVFAAQGKYYELRPGPGVNALKFMLYFNGCKEKQKVRMV